MPHEVVDAWLNSRKPAQLDGLRVRPKEHPLMKGQVVVLQRGQAGAVVLSAEDGNVWILKKFHQGRCPDRTYLEAVSGLLPRHDGFRSGTDRRVLSCNDLKKERGCYYTSRLRDWIDGTLLMPRIIGLDWATIADDVRDGSLNLDQGQRIALCRALAELVRLLEAGGCAHRDLSSGNVFIDTTAWRVLLIDFDSIYHPSLPMPIATTCGTEGYTAPFVWRNGATRPDATWCPQGDRFALALLCAEFLVLDKGAPLGAEGGMFDQQQLRAGSGATLRLAREHLKQEFPGALPLWDTAINSRSCSECPPPDEWLLFCDAVLGASIPPPALTSLDNVELHDFTRILQRRIPAAPVWPAPSLHDLPDDRIAHVPGPRLFVPLPADPWTSCTAPSTPHASNAPPRLDSMENPWP